jgi:hypothetical protein
MKSIIGEGVVIHEILVMGGLGFTCKKVIKKELILTS